MLWSHLWQEMGNFASNASSALWEYMHRFFCVSRGLNTCSVRVVYHFLMRPKRHLCRHSKITVASKVTLHSEVQTDFWKTARSGKSCVVKHSNVRKKLYWGYKATCYTTVYEATAPSTRLWFFSSECDHWQSESLASQIYMMSRYQNHEISMSALSSYFHQECVWMYQQPHKESSEISGTNYGEKGQLAGLCLIDGPLTQNPYWVAGFSRKKLTLARGWNRLNIAYITCFLVVFLFLPEKASWYTWKIFQDVYHSEHHICIWIFDRAGTVLQHWFNSIILRRTMIYHRAESQRCFRICFLIFSALATSKGMSSIDRMKLVQYITPELGAAMSHGRKLWRLDQVKRCIYWRPVIQPLQVAV